MAELKQDVRERAMFGCTWDEFTRSVNQGGLYDLDDPKDALMVSMSLQSDAQELMAAGGIDEARQKLNLSKRIIADVRESFYRCASCGVFIVDAVCPECHVDNRCESQFGRLETITLVTEEK